MLTWNTDDKDVNLKYTQWEADMWSMLIQTVCLGQAQKLYNHLVESLAFWICSLTLGVDLLIKGRDAQSKLYIYSGREYLLAETCRLDTDYTIRLVHGTLEQKKRVTRPAIA